LIPDFRTALDKLLCTFLAGGKDGLMDKEPADNPAMTDYPNQATAQKTSWAMSITAL
jgi:hypothetical protein